MSGCDQQPNCSRTEWSERTTCDPALIVDVLADDVARSVYQSAKAPMTASELAEQLNLSLSTVYRKVERLEDAGLLMSIRAAEQSDLSTHYVRLVDHVSVRYDDPVTVDCVRNGETTCSNST